MPPGGGRRVRLRVSWRRGPVHLRRAVQTGQGQAYPRSPRAGRDARSRRLLALKRQGRCGVGDFGTRCHQRGDRYRHCVHGFDPDGDHHRAGAYPRHRFGRISGMRHGGHHAALREAQFPGEGRQGPRSHDQEGVLSRQDRTARPGARRHSQGRHFSQVPIPVSGNGDDALLQPRREGASGSDQEGSAVARRSEAPHGLHRRRRHSLGRREGAHEAREAARLPVHQYAHGPGRLSRDRSAVPGHARDARHLRSQHGDAELRRSACRRRALR